MFYTAVMAGFGTGAGLIVSIGSQNAFVLRQGLQRHHVGIVVWICFLADVILISAGVAGIGYIVTTWPVLLEIMRFGGALFLGVNAFYSAQRVWKGAGMLTPSTGLASNRNKVIMACLGYTVLNPHVYLDTMLMIGSVSMHYEDWARWGFGMGAIMASFIWFPLIGYGAKLLTPLFHQPLAWRILDAITALIMGSLSVTLLLTPLS